MQAKTKKRIRRVKSCITKEAWGVIASLPSMVLRAQAAMRALGLRHPRTWSRADKGCRDASIEVIAHQNRIESSRRR